MATKRKKIFIAIGIIIALFGFEVLREWVWYMYKLKTYQAAYWKINKSDANKKDVRTLLGEPDAIEKSDAEYWQYNSEIYQGFVWRKLKLHRQEDFYRLEIQFDGEGIVTEVYSFGH